MDVLPGARLLLAIIEPRPLGHAIGDSAFTFAKRSKCPGTGSCARNGYLLSSTNTLVQVFFVRRGWDFHLFWSIFCWDVKQRELNQICNLTVAKPDWYAAYFLGAVTFTYKSEVSWRSGRVTVGWNWSESSHKACYPIWISKARLTMSITKVKAGRMPCASRSLWYAWRRTVDHLRSKIKTSRL